MSSNRSLLLPVLMAAVAILGVSYTAKPVEASAAGGPSDLVKRVFANSNFPSYSGMASQSAPALPEGKGKDLVQQKCVMCHAANVWTSQRHTKDQWGAVLDNMTSKGLQASDDELDTMLDYLSQNFAPVSKDAPPPAAPASDPAAPKPPAQ